MQLIDQEAHFWELYTEQDAYFLSIAVDMSSVVSCWDIVLRADEIASYQAQGRPYIEYLAKTIIDAAYKGDFTVMESRLATPTQQQAMLETYRVKQRQE